jgi:hypothetical protein
LLGLREEATFEAVLDVKNAVERPRFFVGWMADGDRDVATSLILTWRMAQLERLRG